VVLFVHFDDPMDNGNVLALEGEDGDIAGDNRVLGHVQEENVATGEGRVHALPTFTRSNISHSMWLNYERTTVAGLGLLVRTEKALYIMTAVMNRVEKLRTCRIIYKLD